LRPADCVREFNQVPRQVSVMRTSGSGDASPDAPPAAGSARPTHTGRLMNAQLAASYLGVPYTTLLDAARRGDIEHVRIPGCRRWFFDRRDLDRAVERWKERAV